MDLKQLAEWMKTHDIANSLKNYIHNAMVVGENYSAIEDLATKGSATVTISILQGNMRMVKAETHEAELAMAAKTLATVREELKDAQKTIKKQDKEIENLKVQTTKTSTQKKSKTVKEDPYSTNEEIEDRI